MDVYHKVLVKLYEETGGRDSLAVDFKELVKSLGFLGNYDDVTQNLSSQGWIAETPKANYMKITHWGVKEAQKAASGETDTDDSRQLKKSVSRLKDETKLLLLILEEFSASLSTDKFVQFESKFKEINTLITEIKESV